MLDVHSSKMLWVLSYMKLNNRGRECSVGRWSGKIWPHSCPAKLLIKQMALKQRELQSLTGKLQHACKAVSSDHTFSTIRFLWAIPPVSILFVFFFHRYSSVWQMPVCAYVCVFFYALWKPLDTPGTYCSNAVVNVRTHTSSKHTSRIHTSSKQ